MKAFCRLLALALLSSTALPASAQQRVVAVIVTPGAYQFGLLISPLATPVVDAVVRAVPARVLLLACTETPPAKLMQFERELLARHEAELAIAVSDKVCVKA